MTANELVKLILDEGITELVTADDITVATLLNWEIVKLGEDDATTLETTATIELGTSTTVGTKEETATELYPSITTEEGRVVAGTGGCCVVLRTSDATLELEVTIDDDSAVVEDTVTEVVVGDWFILTELPIMGDDVIDGSIA